MLLELQRSYARRWYGLGLAEEAETGQNRTATVPPAGSAVADHPPGVAMDNSPLLVTESGTGISASPTQSPTSQTPSAQR